MDTEEKDTIDILREKIKEQHKVISYGYSLIKIMQVKHPSAFINKAIKSYLRMAESHGIDEKSIKEFIDDEGDLDGIF